MFSSSGVKAGFVTPSEGPLFSKITMINSVISLYEKQIRSELELHKSFFFPSHLSFFCILEKELATRSCSVDIDKQTGYTLIEPSRSFVKNHFTSSMEITATKMQGFTGSERECNFIRKRKPNFKQGTRDELLLFKRSRGSMKRTISSHNELHHPHI